MLAAVQSPQWKTLSIPRVVCGIRHRSVIRKHFAGGDRKLKQSRWAPLDLSKPIAIDLADIPHDVSGGNASLSLEVSRIRIRQSPHEATPNLYSALVDFKIKEQEPDRSTLATNDTTRLLNGISNVFLDSTAAPALYSVSVIKNDPKATFESLVGLLEPLTTVQAPEEPLFVFFVTRAFAAELHARQDLIPFALSKIVGGIGSSDSLQTLLAVVDKLPMPIVTQTGKKEERVSNLPTGDLGSEGFCIASSSSRHFGMTSSGLSNWSPESSRFSHSLGPEKPATVTCSINPLHGQILNAILNTSPDNKLKSLDSYSIQLPLPTTIFENGLRHTLIWSRFIRDARTNSYICKATENIQHAQVTLPFNPGLGSRHNAALGVPLLGLTGGFRVVTCKGNIVRELQAFDKATAAVRPASEGLEKAVSEYFVQKGVRPHTLSVWALVIPRDLLDLTRSKDDNVRMMMSHITSEDPDLLAEDQELPSWLGSKASSLLDYLLNNGAKIRKVTSGGGGWGNKAGLLSLDPETSFQDSITTSDATANGDMRDAGWLSTGLEPIARSGDYIRFFFIPPSLLDSVSSQVPAATAPVTGQASGCEFGVVPSTIDDISSSNRLVEKMPGGNAPIVFHNRFGAMSERGISVQVQSYSGWGESLQSHRNETKIDVPFARFSVTARKTRQPQQSQEKVKHDDDELMFDSIKYAVGSNHARETAHTSDAGEHPNPTASRHLGFEPTNPRRAKSTFPENTGEQMLDTLRLQNSRAEKRKDDGPYTLYTYTVLGDPDFVAPGPHIKKPLKEHLIRSVCAKELLAARQAEDRRLNALDDETILAECEHINFNSEFAKWTMADLSAVPKKRNQQRRLMRLDLRRLFTQKWVTRMGKEGFHFSTSADLARLPPKFTKFLTLKHSAEYQPSLQEVRRSRATYEQGAVQHRSKPAQDAMPILDEIQKGQDRGQIQRKWVEDREPNSFWNRSHDFPAVGTQSVVSNPRNEEDEARQRLDRSTTSERGDTAINDEHSLGNTQGTVHQPVAIRYSNRAPHVGTSSGIDTKSSANATDVAGSSTAKTYRRNVPKYFKDQHSSSRAKAWKLSRHPAARKSVRFQEGSSIRRPLAITTALPRLAVEAQGSTAMSAVEYFWEPGPTRRTPQAAKAESSSYWTQVLDESLPTEAKESRQRRLRAMKLEEKGKRSWDHLVTQVQESTERENKQTRQSRARSSYSSTRLSRRVKEFIKSS
ncbi:hypothetical protein K461DRAFT_291755 [Myriangium duriaei CBS 260.36]|uniref:Uncharacterized protein n=1 Tax=Myriangium duriaei CBS 260.36 TaxID=1168546 RepID=A0A9P4MHJ7_9PEZI|nr:hypothetical protein K461DRAFT_291755 [Myriangium duriaei CBS 260.36]